MNILEKRLLKRIALLFYLLLIQSVMGGANGHCIVILTIIVFAFIISFSLVWWLPKEMQTLKMPCTYQHSYKYFFFLKYKVILKLNDETRLLKFKIQQFECLLSHLFRASNENLYKCVI